MWDKFNNEREYLVLRGGGRGQHLRILTSYCTWIEITAFFLPISDVLVVPEY
jgi:hypothetical protein